MNEDQLEFRQLIEQRLKSFEDLSPEKLHSAQTVELDQARVGRLSRQDALQLQAMSKATQQRSQVEIKRLQSALKRLEANDYGWCEECGNQIPIARLRIDPAAEYCVACAQKLERRGGV